MRITILAVGSRGDVQPYIALGLGLQAAGYDVRIAAASNFESFIREYGLGYGRLDADFRELMQNDRAQDAMASRNPLRRQRELMGLVHQTLERFATDTWEVCQDADAVIYSSIAVTGYSVAEKLEIPSCWAPLAPMSRTRAFPSVLAPISDRNKQLNWLTHLIEEQIAWQPARGFINHWRREMLGLKPFPFMGPYGRLERERFSVLYGFSPSVIPKPSDWGDSIHVTGYWFLDQSSHWQPPAALVDFIESGTPPVYIGFGSMINRDAEALTRLILQAVVRSKQRAVLATGWDSLGNVDELPDTIFQIESIPHEWLFPRMAAVVHHGGAGTTAAGLRAGIPSVIVPFGADQPFWGQRVYELGIGPKPISRQNLSGESLAEAITHAVCDKEMRRRAVAIGEQIRAEDGVKRAVHVFQRQVLSRFSLS